MRAIGGDTASGRAARTAALSEACSRTGLSTVGPSQAGGGARRTSGVSTVLVRTELPFEQAGAVSQAQARCSWLSSHQLPVG